MRALRSYARVCLLPSTARPLSLSRHGVIFQRCAYARAALYYWTVAVYVEPYAFALLTRGCRIVPTSAPMRSHARYGSGRAYAGFSPLRITTWFAHIFITAWTRAGAAATRGYAAGSYLPDLADLLYAI